MVNDRPIMPKRVVAIFALGQVLLAGLKRILLQKKWQIDADEAIEQMRTLVRLHDEKVKKILGNEST